MRKAPMMIARVLAAFRSRFSFLSIRLPRSPRSPRSLDCCSEFVSVFSEWRKEVGEEGGDEEEEEEEDNKEE